MYFLHTVSITGLACLAGLSSAHPQGEWWSISGALTKRQLTESPDNTCGLVLGGANNGFKCGSQNLGPCCSQYVCLSYGYLYHVTALSNTNKFIPHRVIVEAHQITVDSVARQITGYAPLQTGAIASIELTRTLKDMYRRW